MLTRPRIFFLIVNQENTKEQLSLCLRRICIFTFDLLKSNRTEENPLAAIFNKRRVIYANIMVCNIYMSKYICIIFEIYRVNHAIGSGCSSDFVENKKNLQRERLNDMLIFMFVATLFFYYATIQYARGKCNCAVLFKQNSGKTSRKKY